MLDLFLGKFYPQVYLDDCLYEVKMLEYDKIDISEGINVNKTSASKGCNIYHYWYFEDISFKYEQYLCNGCHDLNDVAVVYVKGSAYRIHFWYMSKNDAINIINNFNFIDKKVFCIFLLCIKNE